MAAEGSVLFYSSRQLNTSKHPQEEESREPGTLAGRSLGCLVYLSFAGFGMAAHAVLLIPAQHLLRSSPASAAPQCVWLAEDC